ncbi:ribonuclease H-like YkuK family protein [Paenibacillus alkalitolerans]|uniref:ribonuclease H-like YkuK family protein n=1 Tax=Paenibacillus alkalitolerans TaxID=2799335 RepID=UPI0018F6A588|nr:ribonuclease H-like YkuK family protein [Paenibacillus alkalitolerans]
MKFMSPTWGMLSIDQMVLNMKSFLEEHPSAQYKIVIGTDSHTTNQATTFVTALVIHRVGKGARFFFRKQRTKPMYDLRHRIYRETELSLELVEVMNGRGMSDMISQWPLEIHIDIGQQGETKTLITEIKGWVTAVGYVARIKPESFGASAVADRFTS